jgi:hypothetical protein
MKFLFYLRKSGFSEKGKRCKQKLWSSKIPSLISGIRGSSSYFHHYKAMVFKNSIFDKRD